MYKIRIPLSRGRPCLSRSNSRSDRSGMPNRDRPCLSRSDSRGKRSIPKATFVRDVTVPDGVSCYPGITMTKTWALKNTGLSPWPVGVKLIFISGDLKPERIFEVPCAAAGQIVDVSAVLQAPMKPQQYIGYYRLCTAEGQKFGPRIWVDLVVVQPQTSEDSKASPKVTEPKDKVEATEPPVTEPKQVVVVAAPWPEVVPEPVEEPKPEVKVPESEPEPEPKLESEPKPEAKAELVPVAEPAVPSKYAVQMETLRGMGFTDNVLNDYLLSNNNGNVQRVVEWILSNGVPT